MSWKDHADRQRQPWKAPFCGCFSDLSSCLLSFSFPCVQYGFNAAKIDGSGCFGACCMYCCCMICAGHQCAIAGGKRTTMRNMYMLEESCCCDCGVHWCCSCCALSQEARELEIRGPPKPQAMGNINIIQQTTTGMPYMPSPNGVMMAGGPNGQLVPVQNGASHWVIGPHGQPMMVMYAPAPAPVPAAAPGDTNGTTPAKAGQTGQANDEQRPEGQAQQQGERITTLYEPSPRGSTHAA